MTVEELGIAMLGELIDTSVTDNKEDTFITLCLKIFDVTYKVQVPKHEAVQQKAIYDAWTQLINDFGAAHLSGQAKRIINQGMEISNVKDMSKEDLKNFKH